MIEQAAVFLGAVAVVAALGLAIGMLVAPRLTKLAERDEEPSDRES